MIPNRAQFMIHGMLSLSLSLFMRANQNASRLAIKLAKLVTDSSHLASMLPVLGFHK